MRLAGNVGNIPIPIDCTLRGLTQYSRTNNAEVVQSVETHHRPANFDASPEENHRSVRYSPTAGIAMTFKPIEAAQLRQRAVNRP